MRLPANTQLLIYGTSHMQALASAMRTATKHLGILKSTDLISNSNPCGTSPVFDFEPPDEQVSSSEPVCCGQTAKPCKLNSHSFFFKTCINLVDNIKRPVLPFQFYPSSRSTLTDWLYGYPAGP